MNVHANINARVIQNEIEGNPLFESQKIKGALRSNYLAYGLNPFSKEKKGFISPSHWVKVNNLPPVAFRWFSDAVSFSIMWNGELQTPLLNP